jgi:hypothetical protein
MPHAPATMTPAKVSAAFPPSLAKNPGTEHNSPLVMFRWTSDDPETLAAD